MGGRRACVGGRTPWDRRPSGEGVSARGVRMPCWGFPWPGRRVARITPGGHRAARGGLLAWKLWGGTSLRLPMLFGIMPFILSLVLALPVGSSHSGGVSLPLLGPYPSSAVPESTTITSRVPRTWDTRDSHGTRELGWGAGPVRCRTRCSTPQGSLAVYACSTNMLPCVCAWVVVCVWARAPASQAGGKAR